jgi:hypothetical protein
MSEERPGAAAARPRLFDVVRDAIRRRHYSYRTEETYLHWVRRFILFSGKRHPRDMGAVEASAFLIYLAQEYAAAVSTQYQALAALLFLHKEVLAQTASPAGGSQTRQARGASPRSVLPLGLDAGRLHRRNIRHRCRAHRAGSQDDDATKGSASM